MLKVSAVNHVNVEVPQRLEDTSLERSVDSREGNQSDARGTTPQDRSTKSEGRGFESRVNF